MDNIVFMFSTIEKSQNELYKNIISQIMYFVDDCYIVDTYKSDKMKKLIGDKNIVKLSLSGCDTWDDLKCKCKEFIKSNKVKNVFVIRAPMVSGFRRDSYSLVKSFMNGRDKDKSYGMKYEMTKQLFGKFIFLECCNSINVFHLCVDPYEADIGYAFGLKKVRRLYILKKETVSYCPMYEFNMKLSFDKVCKKKYNDFFFIGSAMTSERKFLYSVRDKLKDDNINFELFDAKDNKKNRISQTEYYKKVSESRYTIIIPPYDESTFSIIRFFEAVMADCVPLVMDNVDLHDLMITFPDIYNIVKEKLVVSISDIKNRIKMYDVDKFIVDEIKSTKSFRKITDESKVRNYFKLLLFSVLEVF